MVQLWDLSGGPEQAALERSVVTEGLLTLAHDLRWLAVTRPGDRSVSVRDLAADGDVPASVIRTGPIRTLDLSPDGGTLATAGPGSSTEVTLWDVASGRRIADCGDREVGQLRFTPDGRGLVGGVGEHGPFTLWDVPTGDERAVLGALTARVCEMAFAPDGRTLAIGDLNEPPSLWDLATGRRLRTFGHAAKRVFALAMSPDGRSVFGGYDDHDIRLWPAEEEPEPTSVVGHDDDEVWAVAFSPDGRILATGGDNERTDWTIRLWEVATGRPIGSWSGHEATVSCLSFAPDGRTLAAGDLTKDVWLWDVEAGRPLRRAPRPQRPRPRRRLLPRRPDPRLGRLRPHGPALGRVQRRAARHPPRPQRPRPLARVRPRRPDPRLGGQRSHHPALGPRGRPRLGDLPDLRHDRGRRVRPRRPDPRLGRRGRRDRPLGHRDRRPRASLKGPAARPRCLAFAPDGRTLASGHQDATIRLWGPSTGQELLALKGHQDWVNAVAFAPDGRTLASASHDGTTRLCGTATTAPR